MRVACPGRRLRWAAAAALLAGWSCGPGNDGQWAPDPSLVRQVPWLNGGVPQIMGDCKAGSCMAVLPDDATNPPAIASGQRDLGSQHTDCAPLANYTFSTGWFDDFEPTTDDPTEVGVAAGWASYDDLTKYSFHAPGDATWYPAVKPDIRAAWGLPSEKTPGPACGGKPNNWVLHFRGGLFRKWGGGMSHVFTDPAGRYRDTPFDACQPGVDFCPDPLPAGATKDSAGIPLAPANFPKYQQSHDFVDVTGRKDADGKVVVAPYDGVSFWARRGPEGQDHVLVILTDKFTSSRLARENQLYCRRIRECHTQCLSGTNCNKDPQTGIYRCFDENVGLPPPDPGIGFVSPDSLYDLMFPRCGPSACTSPQTYLDPDFDSKACRPYTFPAADESGEFCWSEGDPPPPSRDDRCQDGWQAVIQLTPDWTFYAIPFTAFGQVGFGKRAPYMDLKSLDTIAFGSTMGWADAFFDNVTFYRKK